MNIEEAGLDFVARLDNSQMKRDAQEAYDILEGVTEKVEEQSTDIRKLLSDVPAINIDVVTNAPNTIDAIHEAFGELHNIIKTNESAIDELTNAYNDLKQASAEAFAKGNDKEYARLQQEMAAIKSNIALRKNVNREAKETAEELNKVADAIQNEKKQQEAVNETHKSAAATIRELNKQLMEMEMNGQRNTEEYRAVQQEVGRLRDAWQDAVQQSRILSNDQAGFQGIIQGLQGVTGAASVATGVMSLYGSENENLQKAMLKVQALMSIMMGLQQVSTTLNKDSAFSLVTLNGLKELFNKITGQSTKKIAEETAAEVANTTATNVSSGAKKGSMLATIADTVSKKANVLWTNAMTVATKAATLAVKGLKVALVTTGIGAIVVLIGELVGWLMKLVDSTDEAKKKQEELNEIYAKGYETYAKAKVEISDYEKKLASFNGTKAQEKELVNELNSKYGKQMGQYKTLAEWKDVLKTKGEAYCTMLLKEAEAQAILTKYTEAFIALQEARNKKASEYGHWYTTGNKDRQLKAEAEKEAQDEADRWLKMYNDTMASAQKIRDQYDLNPHVALPKDATSATGKKDSYDPQKAALDRKKAIETYADAVKKYVKNTEDELTAFSINQSKKGLDREIKEINNNAKKRQEDWIEQLNNLAKVRRDAAKSMYMSGKGATEVGWANSADGKKTIEDWIAVINKETPQIKAEFDKAWENIETSRKNAIEQAQKNYIDSLVDEFGTYEQKLDKFYRDWFERLSTIPAEFLPQAEKQMDDELSKLMSDNFKESINWESVFGDLAEQSIPVLKRTLEQVREYFEANKGAMGTEEIKYYQEAIAKMEDEIASRNPFAAMLKSLRDINKGKEDYKAALQEMKTAEEELSAARIEAYNAEIEYEEILAQIKDGSRESGTDAEREALEKKEKAIDNVRRKTEQYQKAQNRVNTTQNKVTKSYKQFSKSLNDVGGTISNVGKDAKGLADIFDDKVGVEIGKCVDLFDTLISSASEVIDAIGETGKEVATGIEETASASGEAMKATAQASAQAISTVEKASVILAVISAALRIAMAIANLFNNDAAHQKEIERLQERIDQLQWELDNQDIVRMQREYGESILHVRSAYEQALQASAKMHEQEFIAIQETSKGLLELMRRYRDWKKLVVDDAISDSAKKLATQFGNLSYSVDKALGEEKFASSREQLENLSEQAVLVQKQIDEENAKKNSDDDKITEWERKIEELGHKMVEIINDMVEEIIGGSSDEIASQLGDAFFEAFSAGEDAAEAWGKKVDSIVADIIRRMMVQKLLEEPLGDIFDKYKARWFKDGTFQGLDNVINSMESFRNDLNSTYNIFSDVMSQIPADLHDIFVDSEAQREGAEAGIAQASQESVDELNGRATAIQGHTFSIMENTKLLLTTANSILDSVLNIEGNTDGLSQRMRNVEDDIHDVRNTINDFALRGIKIK